MYLIGLDDHRIEKLFGKSLLKAIWKMSGKRDVSFMSKLSFVFAALLFGVMSGPANAYAEDVNLSQQERTWLVEHPVLRLGVDPAYPPFEFLDNNGAYKGIASDYIKIIQQKLDIRLAPVSGLS